MPSIKKNGASATVNQEISSSLVTEILQETKIKSDTPKYSQLKNNLGTLISQMVETGREKEQISTTVIDALIADIDEKLSNQVDAVLHHPEFQKLESAWRSLKFLVDQTDFNENIRLDIMNVSKEALIDDFSEADITKSGFYKTVYSAEYGQHGGRPFAAMIGNFEFGKETIDINLLKKIASVATMSHAPFIAGTDPAMFSDSFENYAGLSKVDIKNFDSDENEYAEWTAFRQSEDARYVGLTMPRFLLRTPYGEKTVRTKSFNYNEDVDNDHKNYLWGNAAFAFASRLTDSFAQYRWCANIIGPDSGGAVEDLPLHKYEAMGNIQTKIPTETLISDKQETDLSEAGFIPLVMRKGSNNAAFFSANSVQKAKSFGISEEGKQAEQNFKLGMQLPYMFIISRIAHYIKFIQRENIGSWKTKDDLNRELNDWLRGYVSDQDNPSADTRSERPLREAHVDVKEVPGDVGWYEVGIQVKPHFKYMGAYFTLSLVGKLDKD